MSRRDGDGDGDGDANATGVGIGAGVPAVEIEGVSVELGETEALSSVDATVESGRFVGLVGPNGAGKTTLLRTIRATLAPDTGTVRVAGRRIDDLAAKAASRLVASVPQETSLSFGFPVRQAVEMGRTPHLSRFGAPDAEDRDAVEHAMARTAVTEFADRPVTELSGGERQRVLLARALAQQAPVLALDEPTASLDVNHQVRTLQLVRDLVGDGRTAVAAIHDLGLAARYCDELVVLAGGEVLAAGPPASVLTPETVERGFGVRAAVGPHPLTGDPLVTPLLAPGTGGRDASEAGASARADADDAQGRVHVVGDGRARPLLTRLATAGYDLSVGATSEESTLVEAARALDADAVTVPPQTPVDDAAVEAVRERVAAADATVVIGFAVTPGTAGTLRALRAADAPIVVGDRPFASDSATRVDGTRGGGDAPDAEVAEALRIARRLRERAAATPTNVADAVDAVAAAVADATGGEGNERARRDADAAGRDSETDGTDESPPNAPRFEP